MKSEIARLPVQELPEAGPSVVVVPTASGRTLAARYVRGTTATGPLPSGEPLAAIVRSAILSTPDDVRVVRASRDRRTFRIALETRRYEGPLAANVVTIALIQVLLGELTPGNCEVVVRDTTHRFLDLKDQKGVSRPTLTSHRLRFTVRRTRAERPSSRERTTER